MATPPAIAYDSIGNLWVKVNPTTDRSGWLQLLGGEIPVTSSNYPAPIPAEFTLRYQLRSQMDSLLFGKNDTNTQWKLLSGSSLNTNCWTYGVDWSGESLDLRLALVTRRHAITAAHYAPGIGAEYVFQGCTNWVSAVDTSSNDLAVVTFSNEFSSPITPFLLLPTNYSEWFHAGDLGILSGETPAVECVWIRPNTGNVNVKAIFNPDPTGVSCANPTGWSPPIFNETQVTSGDSGGEVFLLINRQPVLLFSTYLNLPAGPLVSWPPHFEFIQGICGSNYPLSFVNLSRYPKVP